MDQQTEGQTLGVNKLAVRLPPFSLDDPEVFFALAEVNFEAAGITGDTTKFIHVISALDSTTRNKVREILLNLPAANRYDTLKGALISRLVATQQQKTRQLLEAELPGTRTPSEYLRHLQNLAGNTASATIIKTLWLSRLPTQTQTILATQTEANLNKLATLADAIADTVKPDIPQVEKVTHKDTEADLRQEINALKRKLDENADIEC